MSNPPSWLQRAREGWAHRGQSRPKFAHPTGPGQESVWDYPRPPALVSDVREVVVIARGREIARTTRAKRVLETASPPTFYLPPQDVANDYLRAAAGQSLCEWKGAARYWDFVDGESGHTAGKIAWAYDQPFEPFESIARWLCFYPSRVECYVDGERVRPQASEFYGGWITHEVIGPFKGDPGTEGW